jgi:PTS system mannose-specific IIB component
MVAWIGKVGANSVAIVDEDSAKDQFMQQVFRLAAPKNIKVFVTGTEGFKDLLNSTDTYKAIVLFKGPINAFDTLHTDIKPDVLIVGNVSANPQRKKLTKYAYVSGEEKEKLHALQEVGWKVYTQWLPDDPKSEFKG